MTHRGSVRTRLLLAAVACLAPGAAARGQAVLLGVDSPLVSGSTPVQGAQTVIDLAGAAQASGTVTSATLGWSRGPCPAAVKIKFFRPGTSPLPPPGSLDFLAERGPFDIPAGYGLTLPFPLDFPRRTVSIFPPVTVQQGDRIGLAVLTSCGGPILAGSNPPASAPAGAVWFDGDVRSTVFASQVVRTTAPVYVTASASGDTLTLLRDRFQVFLSARDPRTGLITTGNAVKLGDGSGYFSLPGLTGDASVPEVTIKMVDATGSPELGGDFWFFYAPLTDTHFMISVLDEKTGAFRSYSSQSGGTAVFCGAADTSAFPL